MTIKEAEERTGLPRSNIRFYEREGLVNPRRNAGNSYREYSEADIEELRRIVWLRTLGISLEDIRKMAAGQTKVSQALQEQLPRLEQQISGLQDARGMCEILLAQGEIRYEDLEPEKYVRDLEEYWQENRQLFRRDSAGLAAAWGGRTAWLLLTAVSLLLAVCALGFLPERIPVQWSGGEAVSFANRGTIFAYPAACVAIRLLLRPVIGTWIRRNTLYEGVVTDYAANCLCFIVLSVEGFMLLFVQGIVHNIVILLFMEALLLIGFLWLDRRRLPGGGEMRGR